MRVLGTGATGYIGGRLVPRLLDAGHDVVCAVRDPGKLQARPWASHPRLTIATADARDRETIAETMHGCEAAYYLTLTWRLLARILDVHGCDGAQGPRGDSTNASKTADSSFLSTFCSVLMSAACSGSMSYRCSINHVRCDVSGTTVGGGRSGSSPEPARITVRWTSYACSTRMMQVA